MKKSGNVISSVITNLRSKTEHLFMLMNPALSEQHKEIIENAKCDLLFLPPYSPDLMPIERIVKMSM